MRRVGLPGVALVFCVVLVALGSGSASARVGARTTNAMHYTDPSGDAGGGPDIGNVNVSNDDTGKLHFSVEVPSAEQLPAGGFQGIWIDPDKNNVNDWVVYLQGTGSSTKSALYHFVNGTPQVVSEPSLTVIYQRGATVEINRAAVGVSTGFQFQVGTVKSDGTSFYDAAPNTGWYSYDVVIGQPQPTITSISVEQLTWAPNPPRAGKTLVARGRVVTNTGSPLPTAQLRSDATVGRAPLKGSGRLIGSTAACTFAVPASAAGKKITTKVTVVYQQLSAWSSLSGSVPGSASLQIRGISTSPGTPHPGQAFYASVGVWRHQAGSADQRWGTGTVSCQATVSGQRLHVILHKALAGYGAQCGWAVPSSAHGATMYVAIALRSGALSVTKAYKFRVS